MDKDILLSYSFSTHEEYSSKEVHSFSTKEEYSSLEAHWNTISQLTK